MCCPCGRWKLQTADFALPMNEPLPLQQQGLTFDQVARGPLIDIIAGARPNFMKIAPILHAIQARQAAGSALRFRLMHTGQHDDERMSGAA